MRNSKIRILYPLLFAVCLFLLGAGAAFAEDGEAQVTPDNGIPVVYVTIDESAVDEDGNPYGTIKEMNESKNHSVHCKGTIRIDVPEGFHYCDMLNVECKSLAETGIDIRGRGNTTWDAKKKPYKIKLDSKENVLGLGKNKHWVLIANAFDHTLMKDRITAWLGDEIGMKFTPRGVPVDFVMQNADGTYYKYLGSYYLSENVRIDTNRIEIDELDETITDPESLEITGGYLIQGGIQKELGSPSVFDTKLGLCLANDTPSFDPADDDPVIDEQKNYIRNYVQKFEDVLLSANYDSQSGPCYRDMMDMESAAKYWLIDALSANGDGYGTGSTYFYKKRDTESEDGTRIPGKIYWGPLWDFDYAWPYGDTENEWRVLHDWILAMLHDTGEGGFVQEIKAQWPAVQTAARKLTEKDGIIDQYYEETKASQAQDYIINPPDPEEYEDEFVYEDEVEALKAWINQRVAWMDKHMNDLDDLVKMITFEADGVFLENQMVEKGTYIETEKIDVPDKEGYVHVGWLKEDGTPFDPDETRADQDMVLTAKYIPENEATHATNLYLRATEEYITLSELSTEMDIPFTVLPRNAQDKRVVWTSSNEEVATVNKKGEIKIHGTGDVVFTGTLKYNSNISRKYTLHVVDTAPVLPKSIKLNKSVVNMHKGKYAHVLVSAAPTGAQIQLLDYQSSNEKVATVDNNGVIYGKGPGTATITAVGFSSTRDDEVTVKAKCKVNVSLAVKKTNTLYVKGKTVTVKRSILKKRAKTIKRTAAIKVTKAKGKVTYKLASVSANKYKKYFRVNTKTGKITVRKGLKKGKYKLRIKVRAAGDFSYKARTRTATVIIKVR